MHVTVEQLPKSQVKLSIELSVEDMKPHLERAAELLSKQHKIEGFRPGKASLGIVVQRLGAAAVWEEAAEEAVRKSFVQAVREHNLKTIGRPHVHVQKLAPDNAFSYTAEVTVLPAIKLGDYRTFKSKKNTAQVPPAEVDRALEDLRSMFATEAQVDRQAKLGDKVEVDFDLLMNNVPVENGSSKQHPVILGSGNFIPGFEEQLVGLKKDDAKEFNLKFPKEYHNSQVAGKEGTFKVNVKSVIEITKPELNEEFAQRAGKFASVAELRTQLEKNLLGEAEQKEDAAFENALIDELIDRSTFGDLPELLLASEQEKMIGEMREQIERQGGSFDDYLKSVKKSVDDVKKEFVAPATRRVKAALLIRTIAETEQIEVPKDEVEKEVQSTLQMYQGQPDILQRIDSEDYRDYVRSLLINRHVIGQLKDWATAPKQ